jgi:RecA/RadA recombinase
MLWLVRAGSMTNLPTIATCMPPGALSAQAIYEKEAKTRKIVTFCQELDAALGGGIATGQVTELCE